ncbi:OsmC family protein [Moelleriella libera RCEF 2490]|uniref:OsmC family protein n=1 Tax=Moelleriella libera RCEF 2490 TaxID=1081109 RepID=A0A166NJY4_9HYPO|nr:OsmC family protein [Moelleriella libera RCEF 2490]
MSASRILLRRAPRLQTQTRRLLARSLNTDTAPVLYTAHATVHGARNGHVKGSEGLNLDLVMPKQLGGKGGQGKTNPEELFAACYGSCFQAAMNLSAKQLGISMPPSSEDSVIETSLHMVGNLDELDLGVKVDMLIKVRGVSRADMDKLVEKTREVCPYSRATKGNVTTNIKIEIM